MQSQTPTRWPTPNPPEQQARVLDVYRSSLPASEFAALAAWTGAFYPFQREWLLEPSRFAVMNKSRQIGNSLTTAAAVVLWAAFLGETNTIVSVGEREAFEVLEKAQKHAAVLVGLGSRLAVARKSGAELRFKSDGRIVALPSSSGGRSFAGNVFIDEYGYVEHPRQLWDAAAGSAMHGYRMRVGSTPNGVGNEFYRLWTDPKTNAGWARHEFSLTRAISEGMKVDLDDCWKLAKGDPRVFAQLFECSFLDNDLQYIPTVLIEPCRVDDTCCIVGENFAGIDVGRSADRTVLYVVRRAPDGVRWVQHTESLTRTEPADLRRLVALAMNDYRCRRLAIDATGLGTFPAAEFQKDYGEHRVDAVTFSGKSKELLATGLYQAIANKTVRFKREDEDLVNALCAIRRIVTNAGNVSYDAPRDDSGHADHAWAMALALSASEGKLSYRTEAY